MDIEREARWFAEVARDVLRYCPDRKQFYGWTGEQWVPLTDEEVIEGAAAEIHARRQKASKLN